MSKTKVSASAVGLPSRRLFLASGPAAAVFASLRKAAAEESPIDRLIEGHKAAWRALDDACAQLERDEDGPVYPTGFCEFDRACVDEKAALFALCCYPTHTPADARAKAEYLAICFDDRPADHTEITALLRSLAG